MDRPEEIPVCPQPFLVHSIRREKQAVRFVAYRLLKASCYCPEDEGGVVSSGVDGSAGSFGSDGSVPDEPPELSGFSVVSVLPSGFSSSLYC